MNLQVFCSQPLRGVARRLHLSFSLVVASRVAADRVLSNSSFKVTDESWIFIYTDVLVVMLHAHSYWGAYRFQYVWRGAEIVKALGAYLLLSC
jgi:hypothetical protein